MQNYFLIPSIVNIINEKSFVRTTVVKTTCLTFYKKFQLQTLQKLQCNSIHFPELWPRTHGNVFLRFCTVYCNSQGNQEQPAHYLHETTHKTCTLLDQSMLE